MNILSKVILSTVALLLIPLIAMQFIDGFNWTGSDFAFAWVLLIGIGFGGSILLNKTNNNQKRVVGVLIILAFLWLWAELAVGVFTNLGS